MGDHAWRITLYNIHTDDTLYSRVQLHVYMHMLAGPYPVVVLLRPM